MKTLKQVVVFRDSDGNRFSIMIMEESIIKINHAKCPKCGNYLFVNIFGTCQECKRTVGIFYIGDRPIF